MKDGSHKESGRGRCRQHLKVNNAVAGALLAGVPGGTGRRGRLPARSLPPPAHRLRLCGRGALRLGVVAPLQALLPAGLQGKSA